MRLVAVLLLACPAGAALAAPPAPPLTEVISEVRPVDDGKAIVARILLANMVDDRAIDAPPTLDAVLHGGDHDVAVRLVRQGAPARVPPRGWTTADYGLDRPAGMAGPMVLSLGGGQGGYAFALPVPAIAETPALAAAAPPPARHDAGTQSAAARGNLSTYRPVYGVAGGGTDSDVKIQLSFQYQLFGHADEPAVSWLDGFRVAYTQSIYWDVERDSQPIRDVSYEPELFYFYRWPDRADGVRFSARGGFLHESNGKGGADSRGYQYLYVEPQIEVPLGSYTVSAGPRLFHYIFGRDNNPDIARYRGHQALALSIGRDDGLKLSTFSRYNFRTGKGSVEGELTYPVRRLIGHTPLYLVVQGFTGYGEDLLDYNRRQTRIRAGVGIVR